MLIYGKLFHCTIKSNYNNRAKFVKAKIQQNREIIISRLYSVTLKNILIVFEYQFLNGSSDNFLFSKLVSLSLLPDTNETKIYKINFQNSERMKKIVLLMIFAGLFVNMSCGTSGEKGNRQVEINTEFGNIKIKLYDETPLHRDNFIKLTKDGFYTDLLFHRVIQGFMIQGGDPESKNAQPGKRLGGGDLGYTIPAEINPKFFHRKGVLAAAREGDATNPEKRSSASQFYIVQGKVFRPGELDSLQTKLGDSRKQSMFQAKVKAVEPELNKLASEGKQDEIMARYNALKAEVIAEDAKLAPIKFTEDQRKAYTTIGGYPSLDNNYTIFGEVTEGLDVLDKIAAQPTDQFNRPQKDIKFTIKLIN